MAYALREGVIDSAVLTSSDEHMMPGGTVARDEAGVLACAGSNFVASPTLATFNQEVTTDAQRIGVVATPCQALALAKMRASPLENRNNIHKLKLVVGLFCTWALRYDGFIEFLEDRLLGNQITRVDIPPPPKQVLRVCAGSHCAAIPLDEVRPFIRRSCNVCIDLTAEFADVSVGAAEGTEGWNTLIVRSEAGRQLVDAALAAGVIQTGPLSGESLDHLKTAALLKKQRALGNIVDETGDAGDLLYLKPSGEVLKKHLEQG
jgi:coenzyme F420 hydrogenase subunit beta